MTPDEKNRFLAEKGMGWIRQREEIYYGGPSTWHDDPVGGWHLHSDGFRTPAEGFDPLTRLPDTVMVWEKLSEEERELLCTHLWADARERDDLVSAILNPSTLSDAIIRALGGEA